MSEFSTTPFDPQLYDAWQEAEKSGDMHAEIDAEEAFWGGPVLHMRTVKEYPGSPPINETTMPIINKAGYVLGWIVRTPLGGYNSIPKKGAWPEIPATPQNPYPNWFGDLGVDTPYEAHNKCWPELDELLGANRSSKVEALLDLLDGHVSDLTGSDHPGNLHSGHFLGYMLDGPVGLPGIYRVNQDGVATTLDGTRELDDPYHQNHTIND